VASEPAELDQDGFIFGILAATRSINQFPTFEEFSWARRSNEST
jgi:hypothetical protein